MYMSRLVLCVVTFLSFFFSGGGGDIIFCKVLQYIVHQYSVLEKIMLLLILTMLIIHEIFFSHAVGVNALHD